MDTNFYIDLLDTLEEMEYRFPDHGLNLEYHKNEIKDLLSEKPKAA